jgi:hypothetical protein
LAQQTISFNRGVQGSKMQTGGKNIQKPNKTKFRKNREHEENYASKKKHHDKSFYRLVKQEKDEYVL